MHRKYFPQDSCKFGVSKPDYLPSAVYIDLRTKIKKTRFGLKKILDLFEIPGKGKDRQQLAVSQ